jgi:hypothetical protein
MSFQEPDFKGDAIYTINATGDCCVGDEVRFQRALFSGSFRNPKFAGFELVTAKIIKDSYGSEKQQHTFTLETEDGETTLIKGRNLYKNGVYRKKWEDESQRKKALDEKHERGSSARHQRRVRKNQLVEEVY